MRLKENVHKHSPYSSSVYLLVHAQRRRKKKRRGDFEGLALDSTGK